MLFAGHVTLEDLSLIPASIDLVFSNKDEQFRRSHVEVLRVKDPLAVVKSKRVGPSSNHQSKIQN